MISFASFGGAERERSNAVFLQILALCCLLLVPGCPPPFPEKALDMVNRGIPFQDLLRNPDKFKGEHVLLGGMIVSERNLQGGTLFEVLQAPLDAGGRPERTDDTVGRFLVRSDAVLDPSIYHPGRMVTVIGRVVGGKALLLDEIMYLYPLLDAEHLHAWDDSSRPRFSIGIGIAGPL